ncbi:MAG: vacuolar protein sorting-associated protein 45 [Watsoniomyces obsoletus]|nr:MAG: vacuolar protein sorting-associated protein 45 [Watsoniomyces obsoletus]
MFHHGSTTRWEKDEPPSIRKRFFKGFQKAMDTKINTSTHDESFEDLCAAPVRQETYTKKKTDETTASIQELINEDHLALSEDEYRLCLFLKNGLARPWSFNSSPVDGTTAAINNLIREYPPPPPKAKDVRHVSFQSLLAKHGKGNCGLYHLTLWIPTGQEHSEKSKQDPGKGGMISSGALAGGEKFNKVIQFFRSTATLTQTVGILFDAFDPGCYQRYKTNYDNLAETTALHSLHFSHRDCFLGRVLLRNLVAEPHKDQLDTRDGWVAICCFGEFTEGHFVVPDLRLKFAFQPGDIIFLRSALFFHYLTDFDGERSSLVFFSHENLNREKGKLSLELE